MASGGSLQDKLKAGIEAARKGDKVNAQRLLRQVVDRDASNEIAWMWLASTLDNLQERRAALEQALKINPDNTRAQEALRQLNDALGISSRRGTPARQTTANLPRVGDIAGGGNLIPLIVGAVLAVTVIIVVIFSVVSGTQQPQLPNPATEAALRSSLLNTETPTPTINPDTYTATPFYGVFVTPDPRNQPTFPPTFTPTFTASPLPTDLPTETPYPMALFTLIYTSLNSGDSQPTLYRLNGDGSGDQQIGAGSDGFSDVAFSPDGKLIAFVRTVTYSKDGQDVTAPELFIAPTDNLGAARQITQLGGTKLTSPSWASDSIQIVFACDVGGDDELWYITEDGNNLRPITNNDFADKDPAWSPNGDVILYASEQGSKPGSGLTEIFSTTLDGETVTQLTDSDRSSYSPSWSRDGSRVVFVSDRSGDGDVYVMDGGGQGVVLLTVGDSGAEDRHPVFAPNGQSVIFTSNRDGGDKFQLYQVDLRGITVNRLADPGRDIQSLSFHP